MKRDWNFGLGVTLISLTDGFSYKATNIGCVSVFCPASLKTFPKTQKNYDCKKYNHNLLDLLKLLSHTHTHTHTHTLSNPLTHRPTHTLLVHLIASHCITFQEGEVVIKLVNSVILL